MLARSDLNQRDTAELKLIMVMKTLQAHDGSKVMAVDPVLEPENTEKAMSQEKVVRLLPIISSLKL